MGPTLSTPYPRRLGSLTICVTKAALSHQSFQDLSVGPARVKLKTSSMATWYWTSDAQLS